jgi:hypothetical protein
MPSFDGCLNAERVRHGQVIADDLNAGVGGKVSPCLPVVLVKRILDRDDRVLFDVADVEVGELNAKFGFLKSRSYFPSL